MLKFNRFSRHVLSFFAMVFVRLDNANAIPYDVYEPKDGPIDSCNILVGGCAPGGYCLLEPEDVLVDGTTNPKTVGGTGLKIPLGYKYTIATQDLTKLSNNTKDLPHLNPDLDIYYRGDFYHDFKTFASQGNPKLCEINQTKAGRVMAQYKKSGAANNIHGDTIYCICYFPNSESSPSETTLVNAGYLTSVTTYPSVSFYDAYQPVKNLTICAAGYYGDAAGNGTGTTCNECPSQRVTDYETKILSEIFGEYPYYNNKTIDPEYLKCSTNKYYITGGCVDCPDNSDCPIVGVGDNQTFACQPGYIKDGDTCIKCDVCSGGSEFACEVSTYYQDMPANVDFYYSGGGPNGQYGIIDNGTPQCEPCPSNAYYCDGKRFYCSGTNFYYQPSDGTGKCVACPSGYHSCDNNGLVCSEFQYQDGFSCKPCPQYEGLYLIGTSGAAAIMGPVTTGFITGAGMAFSGAKSISECFVASATGIADSVGYLSCDVAQYYE